MKHDCLSNVLVFSSPPCTSYSPDQIKNCSVEKLTATLNKFNKCYEWNVHENFLLIRILHRQFPYYHSEMSSPFTFFLRLLQPKAQYCVPNFPIFLTAYNNYAAKVVTPILRRISRASIVADHDMSCSIQSYFSDQWFQQVSSGRT